MASISAKNVVVEFPVFGTSQQSFKKNLLSAATGGRLGKDSGSNVVIRALDELNLELRDGDRVGLVGHNGSGKSTLLRVFAGAYKPVSGVLKTEGVVGSMISLTLGMDFEASGYENILLRGALMGFSKKEISEIRDEIIEFSELGDFIKMPMRTYSSGMVMRLAFALATAGRSDIVLMDEWVSAGDPEFQAKADKRLEDRLSMAKILILASHDNDLLRRHCNKLVRLEHGRLSEVCEL